MKYVVNVKMWDLIVLHALIGSILNPVLLTGQVLASAYIISGWDGFDMPHFISNPLPFALRAALGIIFYFAFFQIILFIFSVFLCVLSPKMKRGIMGEHVFELREEGLFELTAYNESLLKWNAVDKVKRILGRHFVRFSGSNWFVIPDHSFASKQDAIAFADAIRARMVK